MHYDHGGYNIYKYNIYKIQYIYKYKTYLMVPQPIPIFKGVRTIVKYI